MIIRVKVPSLPPSQQPVWCRGVMQRTRSNETSSPSSSSKKGRGVRSRKSTPVSTDAKPGPVPRPRAQKHRLSNTSTPAPEQPSAKRPKSLQQPSSSGVRSVDVIDLISDEDGEETPPSIPSTLKTTQKDKTSSIKHHKKQKATASKHQNQQEQQPAIQYQLVPNATPIRPNPSVQHPQRRTPTPNPLPETRLSLPFTLKQRSGYVYDAMMVAHATQYDNEHDQTEVPERITFIFTTLAKARCIKLMKPIRCRRALKKELMLVHSQRHINDVNALQCECVIICHIPLTCSLKLSQKSPYMDLEGFTIKRAAYLLIHLHQTAPYSLLAVSSS